MSKVVEKRKEYLDICRGMATICVVIIHVSANNWYGFIGSRDWITFTIYEGLSRVAVPIFFMISGCLFLNGSKDKSLKKLYKHSIGKLAIFLLFWSVVYKIIYFPQNTLPFITNCKNIITEIFKGNTQAHLWFIYAITICYIFVPILKPFVRYSSKGILAYGIIACICMSCIFNPHRYFTIGYIGYFLLGAYMDRYTISAKTRKIIYGLGSIASVITVSLVLWDCISSQTIKERFWSYTMPYMYLSSAALFLYLKNCSIDEFVKKILYKISEKSLGIYGTHFVFIILLWKFGFSTFLFSGILSVPVISSIVLLLSYVFSALLQKIPVFGHLIA